ncbi:hypothetical protein LBMAG42_33780 [Deltaproteobacteria bacterium]|nr:hypothetical protein LBMAG42_33780 [Deltaproteobacteria bacterium]
MLRDPAIDAFFARWPRLRFGLLGHGGNRGALELSPLGVSVEFWDAATNGALVARYHAANAAKFGGSLALPGWVLVDLYLMPGAIALLLDEDDAVVAAWCGVPTVAAGVVMGVSMLSMREGIGAAYVVKRLGLASLGARVQRGITQWDNRALRTHTRLGPLRVVGPAPAVHGEWARSFVYEVETGAASPPQTETIHPNEGPGLAALAGVEPVHVVFPGLDASGRVCLARLPPISGTLPP